MRKSATVKMKKTAMRLLDKIHKISPVKYLLFGFLFFVAITVTINNARYSQSVTAGLRLYVTCVMPTLLPFFFLTAMLSRIPPPSAIDKIARPFTGRVLGLCSDAFTMILVSFLSGNPAAAKLISEYQKKQKPTTKQLMTLCAVCSMTSPIFIISTVGAGFFGDIRLGWFLFYIQLTTSIINGIIYKCQSGNPMNILREQIELTSNIASTEPIHPNSPTDSAEKLQADYKIKSKSNFGSQNTNKSEKKKPPLLILSDSVDSCVSSTLTVGAYITIFYLFTDILTDIGVIKLLAAPIGLILSAANIDIELATPVVLSLFEVTKGLGALSAVAAPLQSKLLLASCMLSFSGLSVILQSYNFLGETGLSFKKFFITKITHLLVSLILSTIFIKILF